MKNIHLFETEDAYDAVKSGLILPTVSYIKNNNDVKYNPFNANGHPYVEIAGIKWATMNVGATSITDYGLYFQWGDTQGYTADQVTGDTKVKNFNWSDYKFTHDRGKTFTKYNDTDNKTVLELDDDSVNVAWGGSWKIPTLDEFQALIDALTSSAVTANWTSGYNGTDVAGYEFHDNNSNDTLFLPACGSAGGGAIGGAGVRGFYWLSSIGTRGVSNACRFSILSGNVLLGNNRRFGGLCVRGVLAEN